MHVQTPLLAHLTEKSLHKKHKTLDVHKDINIYINGAAVGFLFFSLFAACLHYYQANKNAKRYLNKMAITFSERLFYNVVRVAQN